MQALPEDYHQATSLGALVTMFKEWNLSEEVASCINGAEDMPEAWRMLDVIYNGARTPAKGQSRKPG
jgi:hypothetical protein